MMKIQSCKTVKKKLKAFNQNCSLLSEKCNQVLFVYLVLIPCATILDSRRKSYFSFMLPHFLLTILDHQLFAVDICTSSVPDGVLLSCFWTLLKQEYSIGWNVFFSAEWVSLCIYVNEMYLFFNYCYLILYKCCIAFTMSECWTEEKKLK